MKFIASILTFLILAMAIVPCADALELDLLQKEVISQSSNIDSGLNQQYDVDKHQEMCSPFCPCQCCPSTNSFDINSSQIVVIVANTYSRASILNHSSFFTGMIWSPPQLLS